MAHVVKIHIIAVNLTTALSIALSLLEHGHGLLGGVVFGHLGQVRLANELVSSDGEL